MTEPVPQGSEIEIQALALLLDRLGVTPEQLVRARGPVEMPTISDYIEKVSAAVSDGTRRLYGTYWRKINAEWGSRRIDAPTSLEIKQLAERVRHDVVERRNARGGRSAASHLISAMRCLYQHAVDDHLIAPTANPAARVAKPRRLASTRHALPANRLAEIVQVAGTTGNDPHLDALILRGHIDTACRRGGALAIRRGGIEQVQSLVRLNEKGERFDGSPFPLPSRRVCSGMPTNEAPVERPHTSCDTATAGLSPAAVTTTCGSVSESICWVATQQISTHWLRHTTLTWVERHFGYAVARAYAGHNTSRDAGVTATYVRADVHEVAQALAALTGEAHPLAVGTLPKAPS